MDKLTLKQYIRKNKIKPADFARKIKVTERSVYNYMNGKYPNRNIERRIKKVLGAIEF